MDLRSKLEALLERDMKMHNAYKASNTPLLSEGLDMFTIETPAKLKTSVIAQGRPQSCCPSRNPVAGAFQNQGPYPGYGNFTGYSMGAPHGSLPPLPKPSASKAQLSFGTIFSDPTPLRLISESPLITPSRFS